MPDAEKEQRCKVQSLLVRSQPKTISVVHTPSHSAALHSVGDSIERANETELLGQCAPAAYQAENPRNQTPKADKSNNGCKRNETSVMLDEMLGVHALWLGGYDSHPVRLSALVGTTRVLRLVAPWRLFTPPGPVRICAIPSLAHTRKLAEELLALPNGVR